MNIGIKQSGHLARAAAALSGRYGDVLLAAHGDGGGSPS